MRTIENGPFFLEYTAVFDKYDKSRSISDVKLYTYFVTCLIII